MKPCVRDWVATLTLVLAFLGTGTTVSAEPFTIRALAPLQDPPLAFTNGQGTVTGFAVELLRLAADNIGGTVTVSAATWADSRVALQSNRVDVAITGGHLDSKGYDHLDATSVYLVTPGVWVTRVGTRLDSLTDLTNRTVCVMEESDSAAYLRGHPIPGLKVVTRTTHHDQLALLADNPDVDIVLMPRLFAREALATTAFSNRLTISTLPVPDFRKEFRFILRSDNRWLRLRLNDAMAALIRSGDYGRLCTKWIANSADYRSQTIIVGGNADFPPFEFLDAHGDPAGHDVELTRELAKTTGQSIEIQLGEWRKQKQALTEGRIDLLMGIFRTDERAKHYLFSRPYFTTRFVAVVRKTDPWPVPRTLDDLQDRVLAVEDGGVIDDLTRGRTNLLRRVVPTLLNTFEELDARRADCVFAPRLMAKRLIDGNPRWQERLRIEDRNVLSADLCFAARPDDAVLIAEVDGAIRTLEGNGVSQNLRTRWISFWDEDRPSLGILLRHVAFLVVPLCGAVLILAIMVFRLRLVVKRRTAGLQRTADDRRQMLLCCPIALFGVDTAGRVLFWNPAAERIFGWTRADVLGQTLPVVQPDRREVFLADCSKATAHPAPIRRTLRTKDCHDIAARLQTLPLLDRRGGPHGLVVAVEDMTEADRVNAQRNRLEARLQDAQRMESIGQLAGGIAHDFNNLLQVIIGYCDLLLDPETGVKGGNRDDLLQVADAAHRSVGLVAQLLAFSRRQVLAMKETDLNLVVADAFQLLRRAVGEQVELRFEPGEDLASIRADASKLGQILMNLCVNARDALPKGGHVGIETANAVVATAAPLEENTSGNIVPPGRYVRLTVRDDGCGMTPDVRKRAFDPFFTTKSPGHGTGLGLSTVYGLVQQHHAYITLRSTPWEGTTFDLFFPAAAPAVDGVTPSEAAPLASQVPLPDGPRASVAGPGPAAPRSDPAAASGTILLAEDAPSVRAFAATILRHAGYTVLEATDGAEAVALYDANAARIDAAVLDVVMPRLNGREVYNHIHGRDPAKPVIFTSGYNADALHTDFVLDPGIVLIPKPYQPKQLLDALRQALAAAAHPARSNGAGA